MEPFYKPVALDSRAREYLNTISVDRTRDTVENAIKAFYSFRRWHSPAPLSWKEMDFDVLVQFSRWLQDLGYNDFSRHTYLSCVAEFLKYALDKEWLKPNFSLERALYRKKKASEHFAYPIPQPSPRLPELLAYYDRLPLPDEAGTTPLALARVRVKRLCLLRNRAIVHTLYASAGRVSEVAQISRKQVQDGRAKEVVITGKGKKQRYLFFTPEAQASIRAYLGEREDSYESLFISHGRHRGQALSRSMLWKIVDQAAQAIGIEAHPHDFRHYRARQMLDRGAPLEAIQEILGHSDIGTTRRVYAHYGKPAIRAIFDKVSRG